MAIDGGGADGGGVKAGWLPGEHGADMVKVAHADVSGDGADEGQPLQPLGHLLVAR